MKTRIVPALMLMLASLAPAAAQDEAMNAKTAIPPAAIGEENALARFEIVTLGSLPIMLFYTDFSFDLGKYIANGFDADYAPWPVKSEFSAPPSDGEKALRIGAAVGASIAVGAIDYLIRQSRAKKARLRREALLEYSAETAAESAGKSEPTPSAESADAP